MADKKVKDIISDKSLGTNEMLVEVSTKLQKVSLDRQLGKLKNVNEIKVLRREIARLKTKLRLEKELTTNNK